MPHRALVNAFLAELDVVTLGSGEPTKPEMATLLQRAAAMIKEYRDEIDFSRAHVSDAGWRDVVFELREMAKLIDIFTHREVTEKLHYASEFLRSASFLMDETKSGNGEVEGNA